MIISTKAIITATGIPIFILEQVGVHSIPGMILGIIADGTIPGITADGMIPGITVMEVGMVAGTDGILHGTTAVGTHPGITAAGIPHGIMADITVMSEVMVMDFMTDTIAV